MVSCCAVASGTFKAGTLQYDGMESIVEVSRTPEHNLNR